MTTDFTELVQSLKRRAASANEFGESLYVKADDVLALVEALEKAQQQNKSDFEIKARLCKESNSLHDRLREAEKRISEQDAELEREREKSRRVMSRIYVLESRNLTVKQGEVLVTVAGFTGCGKSAIAGEIEIAMKAIGVFVTWVNGDSEKRMTGADWLTAIEMYKPTVRIVEENISRAAMLNGDNS